MEINTDLKIDSGDTVKHKITKEIWTVGCVIGGQVFKDSIGIAWDDLDNFILINKASLNYKNSTISRMLKLHDGDFRRVHFEKLMKANFEKMIKPRENIVYNPDSIGNYSNDLFEIEFFGEWVCESKGEDNG